MSAAIDRIPKILANLRVGIGSQTLPKAVRAIEISGVQLKTRLPSGKEITKSGLSDFVKKVLPRIKYNNQGVRINVQVIPLENLMSRKLLNKMAKDKKNKLKPVTTPDADTPTEKPPLLARLTFDGLPSEEILLDERRDALRITGRIFKRIEVVTGEKMVPIPSHRLSKDQLIAQSLAGEETNTPEEAVEKIQEVQDAGIEKEEELLELKGKRLSERGDGSPLHGTPII